MMHTNCASPRHWSCSGWALGVALNERSIYTASASAAQPRNRPSIRGDNC